MLRLPKLINVCTSLSLGFVKKSSFAQNFQAVLHLPDAHTAHLRRFFKACKKIFIVGCPNSTGYMDDNLIALFSFEKEGDRVCVGLEKHYRLVLPDAATDIDWKVYQDRLSGLE